jgi:hypothetical protein
MLEAASVDLVSPGPATSINNRVAQGGFSGGDVLGHWRDRVRNFGRPIT